MSIPVILDTDFATDWGDAPPLKQAALMHRLGFIDLLAVGCCATNDKSPGAIRGSLDYFGCSTVPVGAWKGSSVEPGPYVWVTDLYATFSPAPGLNAAFTDAVSVYREQLAAAADGSVRLICIGQLNQVKALLDSSADRFSALSGSALVTAKVHSLHVMGGEWPNGSEYNFTSAPSAANYVVANWPTAVPIIFNGFTVGSTVIVGAGTVLGNLDASEPCRKARDAYNTDKGLASGTGREAWDNFSILTVVEGTSSFLLTRGTASVNASTGANTWTDSSSGPHYYVTKRWADSQFRSHIDSMLKVSLTTSPTITFAWEGYASAVVGWS